jgi:hypothetical protein
MLKEMKITKHRHENFAGKNSAVVEMNSDKPELEKI